MPWTLWQTRTSWLIIVPSASQDPVFRCPLTTTRSSFGRPCITDLLSSAVVYCRRKTIRKLLIISTGASGFHVAGIAEQYNYVEGIASDAASMVKIAHVASPEWVRSREFRAMSAKNRGLELGNFQAESAALEWLLQPADNWRSADRSASPRINPIQDNDVESFSSEGFQEVLDSPISPDPYSRAGRSGPARKIGHR